MPKHSIYETLPFIYFSTVTAGTVADTVTYPLELIKTRMQLQGEFSKVNCAMRDEIRCQKLTYFCPPTMKMCDGVMRNAASIVWKEGGLMALWRGASAVLPQNIIYSGVRIYCYRKFHEAAFGQRKNPPEQLRMWQNASCGVAAGALAQFAASPLELVKVHMQTEGKRRLSGQAPRVHDTVDAFLRIFRCYGIDGLWKGAVPNACRNALLIIGDVATYESSKQLILQNTVWPDNYRTHAVASMFSGFVAAAFASPADVVKTRLMNEPTDERGKGVVYRGPIDCLFTTLRNEGFPALYKGFVPTWVRIVPWSLAFWLTYEKVRSRYGQPEPPKKKKPEKK